MYMTVTDHSLEVVESPDDRRGAEIDAGQSQRQLPPKPQAAVGCSDRRVAPRKTSHVFDPSPVFGSVVGAGPDAWQRLGKWKHRRARTIRMGGGEEVAS